MTTSTMTLGQQIEAGGAADKLADYFFELYAEEAKNPPISILRCQWGHTLRQNFSQDRGFLPH